MEVLGGERARAGGTGVAVRDLEDGRDRDLIRRVGRGDQQAFRILFERYGPAGKALATRIVRQPFLAEEILQEAFLAVWRNPDAYREDRGSFRSWLLSTVHHRAVDVVRREEAQRRRSAEGQQQAVVLEHDFAEDVVEGLNVGESRDRVRAALGGLPPDQRRVLELMYYEGKTQSTIASELGLPLGTVKSRTLLAMRRLRTQFVREEA